MAPGCAPATAAVEECVSSPKPGELERLREAWAANWPDALAAWSAFTKLTMPRWCMTLADEEREGLSGSFAMIRLVDHGVVISIRQVKALGLDAFATEVLAHEIGHHVYAPADLSDNARLFASIRTALPTCERHAAMVSNLYTDLLINDRLQRSAGLDIAGVYAALKSGASDRLWTLYMRIYEVLWSLAPSTLVEGTLDAQIQSDAMLGARVIRAYSKSWLDGAGRFASLLLPYLLEIDEALNKTTQPMPWLDACGAGEGMELPEGMADIDPGEFEGALHPADDAALSGIANDATKALPSSLPQAGARELIGGRKNNYRTPTEYTDLMQALGVKISPKELIINYYRERARPYIIKFPVREVRRASDPLPEGLDVWDVSAPLSAIDWVESVVRSPHIIPGITTVERAYGTTEGARPDVQPVDLYLGVDCSGSMSNPALRLSYPVLAGTVITLSALRAGANVMTCLSGEPGEFTETAGFSRSERDNLGVLTGYLGTGYAYGIGRLKATFLDKPAPKRPVHLLIVTDSDIFHMLHQTKGGWDIAAQAAQIAGGGATVVLEINAAAFVDDNKRLEACGWNVHFVTNQEELVAFARAFSRQKYENLQTRGIA